MPIKPLAITGSAALLKQLSPFVPDDFINSLFDKRNRRGQPRKFSPAQLYPTTLLVLLTPAHSFNLLVALLPEKRSWRAFAHLRNQRNIPDAKMLHQFRDRMSVAQLRQINRHLLRPLLAGLDYFPKSVAVIDATDLPAATSSYKKSSAAAIRPSARAWARARSKPARAAGLSVIKNTRCASGCGSADNRCCWRL